MPGFNRKGPNEEGPMTGRRMGRCNPENKGKTDEELLQTQVPDFQQQGDFSGLGLGRRRGRDLGRGRGLGMRFRGNA